MSSYTKQCFKSCFLGFVFILFGPNEVSSQTRSNNVNSFSGDQSSSYFFYQQSEYPRDCLEVLGQCLSSNSSGVYLIKPDGYPEPFDVFCTSDGYTIIERRMGNQINSDRGWEAYESGFGFLSHEFWLGNEKLSYITNQKIYQLRIDVTLADGTIFYVTYDRFRISDAHSNYKLVSTGNYQGTTVTTCPTNMVPGNCTCQRSCADPETCSRNTCHVTGSCVCPEGFLMSDGHCIPQSQCPCFIPEANGGRGIILQDGGIYVSPNCGRRCSCTSDQLECDDNFQCSPHGSCEESNNRWNCSCDDGYEGDGQECTAIVTAVDCQDIFSNGQTASGLYNIDPSWSQEPFQVYCNMADGGGWTVFQRQDGSGNFYLYWDDYKNGFGDLDGGMWLGNDKIHNLTNQKNYELRIDLTDRDGRRYYATYSSFRINNETDKYRLASVGTFGGNTGNDYMTWHVNKQFSTRDQDNDGWSSYDCAGRHQGGWWFGYYNSYGSSYSSYCRNHENYCDYFPDGSGCANCAVSYLNGNQGSSTRGRNLFWNNLSGYDCGLQYTEMRIRPA